MFPLFLTLLVQLTAEGGPEVLDGDSPRIRITHLKPKEHVTLHAYRRTRSALAHAFAEFEADERGQIDVDHAIPLKGTYQGADPLGLLWSGEKTEGKEASVKVRDVLFRLECKSSEAHDLVIHLTDGADRVDVQTVNESDLNGVFARPKNLRGPLPSIILLHGSEGGSIEEARANAIRFAQLGYAAFALNYFVYYGDNHIPHGLMNIPVEGLSTARRWLSTQPDVNTEHVAVWGVSKGAEFALVAAASFPWIDRVVACVPSSVVWAGFGRAIAAGESPSSWTVEGKPLPFITYDHYEDSLENRISAAGVHNRSLAKASGAERAAARIQIEKTSANLLIFGATKDHVWPSASMVDEIETTMRNAGKGSQLRAFVIQGASHFICGVGDEITRIDPVTKPEGDNPSPEADAHGNAKTWTETKQFLVNHK